MKEIWFIRHAESNGNAGRPTADNKTNSLSGKGLQQANDLTTYLYFGDEPDLIVHSKYKRAIQTMTPFSQSFPSVPVEEWPVHEFTYLCQEKYANTTETDRLPAKNAYWNTCDPEYVDGVGAESFTDLVDRAKLTLDLLRSRDERLTYVYSHGWFIKLVWWMLSNDSLREIPWDETSMVEVFRFWESTPFPNTGILKVIIDDDDSIWINTWEIMRDSR
jgi:broad specificity phosphatase PhoE